MKTQLHDSLPREGRSGEFQAFPLKFKSYSIAMLRHLVHVYNYSMESNSLFLKGNNLSMSFKRPVSYERVVRFYEKLGIASNSIAKKYISGGVRSQYPVLLVKFIEESVTVTISLSGINLVPISSVLKLLSLYGYYQIFHETGQKPGATDIGRNKTKLLSANIKNVRAKANRSSHEIRRQKELNSCNFCSQFTVFVNRWEFKARNNTIVNETPVCSQHSMKRL